MMLEQIGELPLIKGCSLQNGVLANVHKGAYVSQDGMIQAAVLKICDLPKQARTVEDMKREADVYAMLRPLDVSPEFFGLFETETQQVLAVAQAENDVLTELMRTDKKNKPLITSWPLRWKWMNDIFRCVAAMHHVGVAHLDLSLENCVINLEGEVRLIDFGMSGHFDRNKAYHINVGIAPRYDGRMFGKERYAHPAIFMSEPLNAFAADLHSLGLILFNVLSHGLTLWDGVRDPLFVHVHRRGQSVGQLVHKWIAEEPTRYNDIPHLSSIVAVIENLIRGTCTLEQVRSFWQHVRP